MLRQRAQSQTGFRLSDSAFSMGFRYIEPVIGRNFIKWFLTEELKISDLKFYFFVI